MRLKIVTPERLVFDDEVDAVYAQATDGQVGVLPRHVPLVTPLSVGVLRYVKAGSKKPAAVMGGLLSTNGREVTILTDAAELGEEVDRVRAEEALKRAEARVSQHSGDVDMTRAQQALERARTRLNVSTYS